VTPLRRAAGALVLLLGLDLFVILVTGSSSILGTGAVTPRSFLLRCAVLGALIALRFRALAEERLRMSGARLLLVLLLLPTLAQFQHAGGRMGGDGVMYYVYVRSLWKDLDLDFTNEYTHYGLITRGDLAVTTRTGLRRSIFSVGPAIAWSPFFALGEVVARAQGALGGAADLSGYGPAHRNAVALGSLLYGFAAVLLIHSLLRRHFAESTALLAALLAWGATFLHWYMVQQPTMSHACSTFAAALALWLWERDREDRGPGGSFLLGLALGLAMCVRWQNGVLLALPAIDLLRRLRADPARLRRLVGLGAVTAAGALVGASPQMMAWNALYGMWVLPYPPHGTDFLRLDHPFFPETLFSSRHGLLSWTPVFWAGYLGFVPLLRRRRPLALALLVPLVVMTYVNLCSGDWWAGGSFSNRRFDSLLPVLAFGFAAAVDTARGLLRRSPGALLGMLAAPLVLWNLALAEQVRRGLVPRDDTVSFARLAEGAASLVADAVGSPTTWPASWVFAWRHGRPPSQYDLLVGRYLFYRQNNLGGHVEVGGPGDEAMLGEGWGPVETLGSLAARRVRGAARLFAPLDVPEDLEIRFRAMSAGRESEVRVLVNGREAGRFWVQRVWAEHRVRASSSLFRRELNDVVLEGSDVLVDAVDFVRLPPRGRPTVDGRQSTGHQGGEPAKAGPRRVERSLAA
jgi:hypothetical protein